MSLLRNRRGKISLFSLSVVTALAVLILSIVTIAVTLIILWFTTDTDTLMPEEGISTPLDGSGRAIVVPDIIRAGEKVDTYSISYTAGDQGLMEGASIHLFYPSQLILHGNEARIYIPYLAWNSIRAFIDVPIKVSSNGEAQLNVLQTSLVRRIRLIFGYYRSKWKNGHPAYTLRDLAREFVRRTITITGGALLPDQEIMIEIGGSRGMKAPDYAGWVNISLDIDGDGDGYTAPLGGSPRIIIMGRAATRFRVTTSSVVNIWERMRVVVEAIDDDGQIDPTFTGTVYLDAPELALPGQTEFEMSDLGRKSFSVRTAKTGVFFVKARDGRGRKGRSNPTVIRESGLHLYWGDLHLRSIFGIGDNMPEYILRTARDELNLDFAGVVMVDNEIPLNSHNKKQNLAKTEFAWEHLQKITHTFDKKDKFVAFPAFDWASNEYGHREVIYSPHEVGTKVLNHADERYDNVDKLFKGLMNRRALVIPIWSAWRGGEFMGKKYDWGSPYGRRQRLVEIYSSDGAVEFCKNPFPIHGVREEPHLYSPSDEASCSSGAFVRDILAKGHKLGVVAGGARRFSLDRPEYYTPGLTAVWANKLNAHEIWYGLYEKRAYATTGPRIYIDFKINGAYPGGEVPAAQAVAIELLVVGADQIAEAKVIKFVSEYETARVLSSSNEIISTRWIDTDPPAGGFYFLRVVQQDGHMAWAGPIWMEK